MFHERPNQHANEEIERMAGNLSRRAYGAASLEGVSDAISPISNKHTQNDTILPCILMQLSDLKMKRSYVPVAIEVELIRRSHSFRIRPVKPRSSERIGIKVVLDDQTVRTIK